METLKLNSSLESREPEVALERELPPGRYVVRLVVKSSSGAVSEPAELLLSIVSG